jgi:hypothetical protein
MAYEIPDQGQLYTLPASTGLIGKQFRFVVVNGSGQAELPAVGVAVAGVLQNTPEVANDACTVLGAGISIVEAAGSTVAVGDLVSASSIGRAKAVGAGEYAVGRVVFGSSGSTGRYLSVRLESIGTT